MSDVVKQTAHCSICGSGDLIGLEFSLATCMRTDGLLVTEPLFKQHCNQCGTLIGRNSQPDTRYMRSSGASPYDLARHLTVAQGIARCIEGLVLSRSEPPRVLEVGAASFMTALNLKKQKPKYSVSALELHPEFIPETNEISIIVDDLFRYKPPEQFDILFSNHVIEHFNNPAAFLRRARSLVSDNGVIIACCPTYTRVSNELLFADHLFHFTAKAMSICATDAGLKLSSEFVSDWDPLTHVYIFHKSSQEKPSSQERLPEDCYISLLKDRAELLNMWFKEDCRLLSMLSNAERVSIYGAGEFTQLVRTYTPKIWSKVDRLVVDCFDGIREFDRPVLRLSDISIDTSEIFLIGAHKTSHDAIHTKLIGKGIPDQNIVCFAV